MSSFITNIDYPYQNKWDKTKLHATFTLQNIHFSMANALRRSMISMSSLREKRSFLTLLILKACLISLMMLRYATKSGPTIKS